MRSTRSTEAVIPSKTADPPTSPIRRNRQIRGVGFGISGLILASHFLSLVVLVAGALGLNAISASLVAERAASLRSQAGVIASVLAEAATQGDPAPALNRAAAVSALRRIAIPSDVRLRLFDLSGAMVADSYLYGNRVEERPLPPLEQAAFSVALATERLTDWALNEGTDLRFRRLTIDEEVALALAGEEAVARRDERLRGRIIGVSLPVQRVQAVVGVLSLESAGIEALVRAERAALLPVIVVAGLLAALSALMLGVTIARPLRHLARSARAVEAGAASHLDVRLLARRKDEIGVLSRSLRTMTTALIDRAEANQRFAADVAHEIRNPLNSIRRAADTLAVVVDPDTQAQLRKLIVADVLRLDRLVTDVALASRIEAQTAREAPSVIDLGLMLDALVATYADIVEKDRVRFSLGDPPVAGQFRIVGWVGSLEQVFRNILDNAVTFSPPGGVISLQIARVGKTGAPVRVVIDDEGPGIPPDALQAVFERFYTDRPKGAAFGAHSGLGLAIARQIVSQHQGRIWAENRSDVTGKVRGARFTVELPSV